MSLLRTARLKKYTSSSSLALSCSPDLHCLIPTPRGDAPAIGRPRHRFHKTRMPPIDVDMVSIGSIPHLHRVIITPRGDALAIGRPRHRSHSTGMPAIGVGMPAIGRIPHLHRCITSLVDGTAP